MTKIIPVLDLLNQTVVRGVAGQRDQYQPVQSCLVDSSDPLIVANAIRERYAFNEFYVADLDSIQFQNYGFSVIQNLIADGFDLIADAGLRDTIQLQSLCEIGVQKLVAGLETIPDPEFLIKAGKIAGWDRLIFSLDMMNLQPLAKWKKWKHSKPVQIAEECVGIGIRSFIILDLKQVGTGEGLKTLEICQQVNKLSDEISVITGGGIRTGSDIEAACSIGLDGLLVSSAIHNGNLDDILKSPHA